MNGARNRFGHLFQKLNSAFNEAVISQTAKTNQASNAKPNQLT